MAESSEYVAVVVSQRNAAIRSNFIPIGMIPHPLIERCIIDLKRLARMFHAQAIGMIRRFFWKQILDR